MRDWLFVAIALLLMIIASNVDYGAPKGFNPFNTELKSISAR